MNFIPRLCKARNYDVGGVSLKKLKNKKLTSTEFMQVWLHYDIDNNGYLEYTEFSKFMKDLFLKKDCTKITPKQVEKYTAEMIRMMDTYDEDGDGKFEMNELAKVLKLEKNFLVKIINQKTITDRHVKSILSHYNSNMNETIEGAELSAFIGDIARYLDQKLTLSVIEAGVARVKEVIGTDIMDASSIKTLLAEESIVQLKTSFTVVDKT